MDRVRKAGLPTATIGSRLPHMCMNGVYVCWSWPGTLLGGVQALSPYAYD